MKRSTSIILIFVFAATIRAQAEETNDEDRSPSVSYDGQVRPIFQARCFGCHQRAKAGGDYVMTSFEELLRGGESDQPAVIPGNVEESYLIEQIRVHDDEAAMPKDALPLSNAQIKLIAKWIASGAVNDSPSSARRTFDQEHPPQYSRPPVITALDVSPNGELLAVSGFHEVLVHSLGDSNKVTRLIGQSERIESVRFSPDGKRLAVTGGIPAQMGEIQIWDVDEITQSKPTGRLLLSKPLTFDSVYGVSWSPNGRLVGFGCTDSTVRAISADTGEQVLYQGAHDGRVLDTAFSMDGSHLVSVGRDMTAKLTEIATQRFIDNITSITPKALKGGIQAVVRHPLRDEVIFGGADGVPKIYQMHRTANRQIGDDANQLWELSSLPGRIFGIDVSSDGRRIVAASSLDGVGHIHIYEMDSSPVISDGVKQILKKPTHQRSEAELTQLKHHFAAGVNTVAKLQIDSSVYAVAISHDGLQVFAGGTDGIVRQIDGNTGQITREFSPVDISDDDSLAGRLDWSEPTHDDVDKSAKPNAVTESETESLEITPSLLTLSNPSEYAQAIVTARLHSGQTIDVTRNVVWKSSDPSVLVLSTGLIRPTKNGNATVTAKLRDHVAECQVEVAGLHDTPPPDFIRDVNPILTKVGCNAGTCHGTQEGKNGFKLSLRGYDPLFDVRALTDDLASRRVNLTAPDASMMLQKSTAAVPHEGGQVIKPGSQYYRVLRDWIAGGAKLNRESTRVKSLDVFPINPVAENIGATQQVRVIATYEDGGTRDVTREAFVESGNTDIVQIDTQYNGLMHALRRGEAALLVRYEGAYATTTLTVMGDREGFVWQQPVSYNRIDQLVAQKLRRTKTLAAPTCDDYTFVRRVHLDLTGLPPTPDAIREFVGDENASDASIDPSKRDKLIDDLIGSREFVEHWTNKWADLLQVNGKFLGRDGAIALRKWIYQHVEANTPYDQFAREILTASGSTRDNPAAAYYKILRTPQDALENTTHLFLGTRFNCNKCHDHPFERWTQDQYYQLGAFFAQVGRKADPRVGDKQIGRTEVEVGKPLEEIVYDLDEGELQHDRTGELLSPQFPFDCDFEEPSDTSRRTRLAAWITSPNNPYFARSYVNRLWGYLTGRGIIEPIDDIRAGNPPTNPELLDYLTGEFLDSGFDARHILRLICRSRTYQLSFETNQWNEDDPINCSHTIPRRLSAESLYDAIHLATGSRSKIPDLPEGMRAAALPDAEIKLPDGFLGKFGRPARESACECERSSGMQLGPVIALISGPTVGDAISDEQNEIARLAKETSKDSDLIDELYLRVLCRPVTSEEVKAAEAVFSDIADKKRLRKGGPGNGFDGNYALTEFEAAYAPQVNKQPVRVLVWDFASDTDGWSTLVFGTRRSSLPTSFTLMDVELKFRNVQGVHLIINRSDLGTLS